MVVQSVVNAFVADQFHDRECGTLGQQAIFLTGPVTVQVTNVDVGQVLGGGVVDVDLGIGPGIQLGSMTLAHTPGLGAVVGIQGVEPGISLTDTGDGGGRVVSAGDDENLTLGNLQVLGHQDGGHGAGGLFGVRTADDQEGTALNAAVVDVDVAVVDGAGLDGVAVIGELLNLGATFADNDGLLEGTMLTEQEAGSGHAECDDTQSNNLDGIQT